MRKINTEGKGPPQRLQRALLLWFDLSVALRSHRTTPLAVCNFASALTGVVVHGFLYEDQSIANLAFWSLSFAYTVAACYRPARSGQRRLHDCERNDRNPNWRRTEWQLRPNRRYSPDENEMLEVKL